MFSWLVNGLLRSQRKQLGGGFVGRQVVQQGGGATELEEINKQISNCRGGILLCSVILVLMVVWTVVVVVNGNKTPGSASGDIMILTVPIGLCALIFLINYIVNLVKLKRRREGLRGKNNIQQPWGS